MNKGGPICKEKFESVHSSGWEVDQLGEVEFTQKVKQRLVDFNWVPVTGDDLICPVYVRKIEISPAPEGAARIRVVNQLDVSTHLVHVLAIIVRWAVRRTHDKRFLALTLNLHS